MVMLLKLFQAIFVALTFFCCVSNAFYQQDVTGYRRGAAASVPPAAASTCPANSIKFLGKRLLERIIKEALELKAGKLVDFEEKHCVGGKCYQNLFTLLTCKCQIRGKKDEDSLAKRWALKIADKVLKNINMDFKTQNEIRDKFQRMICQKAKSLRDQYCDSLSGKTKKDCKKDDEKRKKDKIDKKKDEQKKDDENISDVIDNIGDDDTKKKIKKKEIMKKVVIAKCIDATQTILSFTKEKIVEAKPLVSPIPAIQQLKQTVGDVMTPKLKMAEPVVAAAGSSVTEDDSDKEDAQKSESAEPRPESMAILEAVRGVLIEQNKFVSQLESASATTMFEVRFWVDVVKCFRELLDEAQKALDDDPAASKVIEQMCHATEKKTRQYFITLFRKPTIPTRKLIWQIFNFNNRVITGPIIDMINELEDDSSNNDDDSDAGDHPEIFDGDVVLLCPEERLEGLACYSIDVTKCGVNGVIDLATMKIKFKSMLIPPGMFVRVKREKGKKNIVGLIGINVWSHAKTFTSALEINAFTKGQFKQMNGDDDDKIKFGEDSVIISGETEEEEEPEPEPPAKDEPEPKKEDEAALEPYTCYEKKTPMDGDGGGKSVYLDRHDLRCGDNEAIASFRLSRDKPGKNYQYVYQCCKTQLPCTKKDFQTELTPDGKGNMVYLDRQNVECSEQYLSEFALGRDKARTKINYNYQCCQIDAKKDCKDFQTKFSPDGSGNAVYLDRQNVKCPKFYSLSHFKLERDQSKLNVRYAFTCCRTLAPEPKVEPEPVPPQETEPEPKPEPEQPEPKPEPEEPEPVKPEEKPEEPEPEPEKPDDTEDEVEEPEKPEEEPGEPKPLVDDKKEEGEKGEEEPSDGGDDKEDDKEKNKDEGDDEDEPVKPPEPSYGREENALLKKGNLIATIPKMKKEFSLSMDIKPIDKQRPWTNIFRMGVSKNEKDRGDFGNRIPTLMFKPNSFAIQVCMSINSNSMDCTYTKELEKDKYTNIVVRQIQQFGKNYKFSVLFDGEEEVSTVKINKKAREFDDVKMYAGGPYTDPAKAELKNIQFNNLVDDDDEDGKATDSYGKDEEFKVGKSNLIGEIPIVQRGFRMSFDLKPLGKTAGWTEIARVTGTSKNCCNYGDRVPFVAFAPNSLRLVVANAINSNGNHYWTQPKDLKVNEYSSVVITQKLMYENVYRFSIEVDDEEVYVIVNTKAEYFKNAKFYAGSEFYNPANAMVKNLKFENIADVESKVLPRENVISIEEEFEPIKSNFVGTLQEVTKEFRFALEVKPVSKKRGWTSIARITTTEKNCCSYGDRIPIVHFWPNSLKLRISHAINGRGDFYYDHKEDLKLNEYAKIVIEQRRVSATKYKYTITINDKEAFTIVNSKAESFTNAKVFAGDNHMEPADVKIKNFRFENLVKTVEKPGQTYGKLNEWKVTKGNLLATIPEVRKGFRIAFDVKPLGKVAGWNSLIHLTSTGRKCCNYGDRIPAFIFRPNSYRLRISNAINGRGDTTKDVDLTPNVFTNILVEQRFLYADKYRYSIKINSKEIFVMVNKKAENFKKVKLWAANDKDATANAMIKNVEFENLPDAPPKPIAATEDFIKPEEFRPTKATIIGALSEVSKGFRLTLDIKPLGKVRWWGGIARISNTDNKCCKFGDRNPLLQMWPNSYKMRISHGVNGNWGFGTNIKALKENEFSTIVIEQVRQFENTYKYSITVNGNEEFQITNKKAVSLKNAKVFAGDVFMEPANVIIKNFKFENLDGKVSETSGNLFAKVDEFKIEKNTYLTKIQQLSKEFSITFEVKPMGIINSWGSILHMQSIDKSCCNPGTRVPGVWFNPRNNKLHICFAINGNGNNCFNTKGDLAKNKYSKITIQQRLKYGNKYRYSIEVNDEEVFTISNVKADVYNDVKVFAANPYINPADAFLRNIKIENFEPTESPEMKADIDISKEWEVKKDNLLGTMKQLNKDFSVSLEVKPKDETANNYASIFRMQNVDRNCCQFGTRIPYVSFLPRSTKIIVCFAVNRNGNHCWSSKEDLPKNKYTTIRIQQRFKYGNNYRYSIDVGDEEVYTITNQKASVFKNVRVYSADEMDRDYARAFVKNLKVQNLVPDAGSKKPKKPYDWYGINEETKVKRNNYITTIPSIKKEFSLTVTVKPTGKVRGTANIVRLASDNTRMYGAVGRRIPTINFKPNSLAVIVCFPVNNLRNDYCKETPELTVNKYSIIVVEQIRQYGTKYRFSVTVNGKEAFQVENSKPREFEKAKLYVGDEFSAPAEATVRRVKFQNTEPDADELEPGKPITRPEAFKLTRNAYIGTLPKLSAQYSVKFELKPLGTRSGWTNIIHLTASGRNCCGNGDRMPGIWFNSRTTKLHVCASVNGRGNTCFNAPTALDINEFNSVEVKQTKTDAKYQYSILVDGKQVYTIENKQPKEFRDLRIYAADTWYNEANAVMRNLEIKNFDEQPEVQSDKTPSDTQEESDTLVTKPDQFQLVRNKLIGTIPSLSKEWSVSFDIKPLGTKTGWSSVIHLTTGANCCHPGSRIASVWFPSGTTKPYICTQRNSNGNWCYNTPAQLAKNVFVRVLMQQNKEGNKYMYTINIDGKEVQNVVNNKPTEFKDVKVFAADNWYNPSNAILKNLVIKDLVGKPKEVPTKDEPVAPPPPPPSQPARPVAPKIPHRAPVRDWTCKKFSTPWNNEGGGKSWYLDRQSVSCPANQVIRRFRLRRSGKGKYQYEFECCAPPSKCARVDWKTTPSNDDGGGNMVYLDRHAVQCGNNFLQSFRMIRPASNKISYKYSCCVMPEKKSCYTGNTAFDQDGRGNTVYLDRQNVVCNKKNYGLTYFKLNRNSARTRVRYSYQCCTVREALPRPQPKPLPPKPNPLPPKPDVLPPLPRPRPKPRPAPRPKPVKLTCRKTATPWNSEGGGKSVYLDRHQVQCGANEIVRQFRLSRNGKGKYQYVYWCCRTPVKCESIQQKNTRANDWGKGNMVYLDRHAVSCGDNFLTSFKLYRPKGNQIAYRYGCCVINKGVQKTCYVDHTPYNNDGGGNAIYLDRHRVRCRTGYGIVYFTLQRSGSKIRYAYRCCTMKKIPVKPQPEKPQPEKPEPEKPEPEKPQPEKPEPGKPKPEKPEPEKPEPEKPEPEKPEPEKPEPEKPEPEKPEPEKPEPEKPEPEKPEEEEKEPEEEPPPEKTKEVDPGVTEDNPAKLKKNNLIGTIAKVTKEWTLSFTIKPIAVVDKWTNIIHITTLDNNSANKGGRIPNIAFQKKTTKLNICTAVDDNFNKCWNSDDLPIGKETTVLIEQKNFDGKYKTLITINDKAVASMDHTKEPSEYNEAKLFASDNFFDPADAEISKLEFKNEEPDNDEEENAKEEAEDKEKEEAEKVEEENEEKEAEEEEGGGGGGEETEGDNETDKKPTEGEDEDEKEEPEPEKTIEEYGKEEEFKLVKSTEIATIPKVGKTWSLSFDIKPLGKVAGWNSIVHMSSTDTNCCGLGTRHPAVFFWSTSLRLLVCSAVGTNGNRCQSVDGIVLGKDNNVLIEQSKDADGTYQTSVTVNGKEAPAIPHPKDKEPAEYENVKMYSASPWHAPANAMMKNLQFKNTEENEDEEKPEDGGVVTPSKGGDEEKKPVEEEQIVPETEPEAQQEPEPETKPEEPKKDDEETIEKVNPPDEEPNRWLDKFNNRHTCLERPIHGTKMATSSLRLNIPKGVRIVLKQYCGAKKGTLPDLPFCGPTKLDFSQGKLAQYNKITILTSPKRPKPLPIVQDEDDDEKKDREEQDKENEAGKTEEKQEKGEEEDEKEVDDDVEIPPDNNNKLRGCDENVKASCVYAKDLVALKNLAEAAGLKIIYIYIPPGTDFPLVEVPIAKVVPGEPLCAKLVAKIAGPAKLMLAELEKRIEGNPTLECATDREVEAAKEVKKAARRRSFLERYSSPGSNPFIQKMKQRVTKQQ